MDQNSVSVSKESLPSALLFQIFRFVRLGDNSFGSDQKISIDYDLIDVSVQYDVVVKMT